MPTSARRTDEAAEQRRDDETDVGRRPREVGAQLNGRQRERRRDAAQLERDRHIGRLGQARARADASTGPELPQRLRWQRAVEQERRARAFGRRRVDEVPRPWDVRPALEDDRIGASDAERAGDAVDLRRRVAGEDLPDVRSPRRVSLCQISSAKAREDAPRSAVSS